MSADIMLHAALNDFLHIKFCIDNPLFVPDGLRSLMSIGVDNPPRQTISGKAEISSSAEAVFG